MPFNRKCEVPSCEEETSYDSATKAKRDGWRLVGTQKLDIERTDANTRLCPDCHDVLL